MRPFYTTKAVSTSCVAHRFGNFAGEKLAANIVSVENFVSRKSFNLLKDAKDQGRKPDSAIS